MQVYTGATFEKKLVRIVKSENAVKRADPEPDLKTDVRFGLVLCSVGVFLH